MAGVRDYSKLAVDIRDAVGEENIISATHCATRLRLVLKQSPPDAVTKKISSMAGVIQVVEKGGQYQVVIGTHAKDVYEELTKVTKLDASAAPEIKQSVARKNYRDNVSGIRAVRLHFGGGRFNSRFADNNSAIRA